MASTQYLPQEIWSLIVSKLSHDHLEPLSLVSKNLLSITNLDRQTLKIFNPTPNFIPSIFRRFPNIKHISFSEYSNDPIPVLRQIAQFIIRLETLDLSNHMYFPIHELSTLPSSMLIEVKSFKLLSLRYIDLENIAYFFPNLEELDLFHSTSKDYDFPSEVKLRCFSNRNLEINCRNSVSVLKGLSRINFNRNSSISDETLILLSKNCPNLEEIVVKRCSKVSLDGVVFALQECKNLKSIGLGGNLRLNNIRKEDVHHHLHWPPKLSKIDLSLMYVCDDFLRSIVEVDLGLKSFSLLRCHGFTLAGLMSFLQKYSSLDCFDMEELMVNHLLTDASFSSLIKLLTKARNVKLNNCKISESTLFGLIEQCPLLESVEMESVRFSKQVSVVSKVCGITSLSFSGNINLRDGVLFEIISTCRNLERLNLSNCTEISSNSVREVMRTCLSLKHFEINGCLKIEHLGLEKKKTYKLELLAAPDTSLNDKALLDIAEKCPELKYLSLRGCKGLTSDGVIEIVKKCSKLKMINLWQCRNIDTFWRWIDENKPFLTKFLGCKTRSRGPDKHR